MESLRRRGRETLGWVYKRPGWFPAVSDGLCWGLSIGAAAIVRWLFFPAVSGSAVTVLIAAGMAIATQWIAGWALGSYRHRWRVSSFDEVLATFEAWALATVAVYGVTEFASLSSKSWDLASLSALLGAGLAFVAILLTRIGWRKYWERYRRPDPRVAKRTIVFGAGDGADHVIRLMLQDRDSKYVPVAMLDDNPSKRNRMIHGVEVKGTREDFAELAKSEDAKVLLVAVRDLDASVLKPLSKTAHELGMEMLVLPSTSDLVGSMTLSDLRPPKVEELLGRDAVQIDMDAVAHIVGGRRVLITGAGGSIGSELSRVVDGFEPSALFLVDRDETALHSLQLSMEGRALLDSDRLVVADIRDRERMFEMFDRVRPEVVFHVAALKHLTLLERHPEEAIKTNVLGTKNVLDAAVATKVARFVNISTDKAADPTSMLGASKLAAERLTAEVSDRTGLPYVSVRFGNVLGSRGSVLPTFIEQIKKGKPITITDPEVTRYFMTIPEAVRLVLQAAAIGRPGEVMILDMGEPVKIVDLARQVIDSLKPGHPVVFTGLRPGEKLHEVLVSSDEAVEIREHPRVFHTCGDRTDPASAFCLNIAPDGILKIRKLIECQVVGDTERACLTLTTRVTGVSA